MQCLETSYGVSTSDEDLDVGACLPELFRKHLSSKPSQSEFVRAPEATAKQKEEAERLKNEGNIAVREERIQDAVDKYTQAIALDGNNAALYSNRAATYNKLGNYTQALADAEHALLIDSNYTKAHGRIATAYIGLNRLPEAHAAAKRALEREPDNESYLNNLRAIEARMNDAPPGGLGAAFSMAAGAAGGGGGIPGLDSLMSNPALMNMATQMMQQPAMQQMMSTLMGGAAAPPAPPAGSAESAPQPDGAAGFQAMLQAGQQLAEQMRSTNPELIEQLRQQMGQFDPNAQSDSS